MSHLFEIVHIRQYTLRQIHSKHMELNMFLVLHWYGFDMIGEPDVMGSKMGLFKEWKFPNEYYEMNLIGQQEKILNK